jgi:hypothetical protein
MGNKWTFVLTQDLESECDGAYLTEEVYALDASLGRDAVVVSQLCAPSNVKTDNRLAAIDGQIFQWFSPMWRPTHPSPLVDGYKWVITNGPVFRWKFAGEVTVPAGTFQNCWTRVHVPLSNQKRGPDNTYCPGIGRVRMTSATMTLELASYSVK